MFNTTERFAATLAEIRSGEYGYTNFVLGFFCNFPPNGV